MNLRQRDSQNATLSGSRSSALSAFMSRVYGWMMLGILVTGAVAMQVGSNPELVARIFGNTVFFIALIVVQLGSVVYLSAMINRISAAAAGITFMMYSALTGLTFSMIFVIYTEQSIASAFATTAMGFGGLSLYGYTTKRDLGPIGSFCGMALFGLIGMMFLSFFFPSFNSSSMQLFINIAGLVIFAGLTAYDTQRIKCFANAPSDKLGQMAILGALTLYLDFINLFLFLLRFMGDRK